MITLVWAKNVLQDCSHVAKNILCRMLSFENGILSSSPFQIRDVKMIKVEKAFEPMQVIVKLLLQLLLQLCVNLRVVSFHWDWEKNLKKIRGLNCLVVLLLLQCVHKQISEKCRLGYAKIMDSCWLLQVTWLFWVNQSVLFQHSYTSLIFVYVIGSCLYLEVS